MYMYMYMYMYICVHTLIIYYEQSTVQHNYMQYSPVTVHVHVHVQYNTRTVIILIIPNNNVIMIINYSHQRPCTSYSCQQAATSSCTCTCNYPNSLVTLLLLLPKGCYPITLILTLSTLKYMYLSSNCLLLPTLSDPPLHFSHPFVFSNPPLQSQKLCSYLFTSHFLSHLPLHSVLISLPYTSSLFHHYTHKPHVLINMYIPVVYCFQYKAVMQRHETSSLSFRIL